MRKIFFLGLLPAMIVICSFGIKSYTVRNTNITGISKDTFIRAADLSFLPEIRQSGTVFYDKTGKVTDALMIFKNNGCNTVRIRVWNNPRGIHSSLQEVTAFAAEVKKAGMRVMLDFHYSDYWADPGKQAKPAAWKNLNDRQLNDSIYAYTKYVLRIIRPEYVQIGNEINHGLLWPNGAIDSASNFTGFLKSGIKATREESPSTKIIIHYAGYRGADDFYTLLRKNGVDYDIIGLSYYPRWHGKSFDSLANIMKNLVTTNHKSIIIAETAYPFTLGYNDKTNNDIGDTSQIIAKAFPPTPEGQKAFLFKLRSIIEKCPRGMGFSYWAPDWVAFKGPNATNGSGGENLALFDFNNKVLPGMEVYHK